MYNILVCDDEKDIVSALTIYLQAEGYQVFGAANGLQALETLRHEQIHLDVGVYIRMYRFMPAYV